MNRKPDTPTSRSLDGAATLMFVAPVFGVLSWGVATFAGIALKLISGVTGGRDDDKRSPDAS